MVAALVCSAGCSGAGSPHAAQSQTETSRAHVTATSNSATAPPVLRAHRLRYGRAGGPTNVEGRGHPVPASAVTNRVDIAGAERVGLADAGSYFGRVYMVISHDRGRTWTIDSPEFYYSAAHAAAATTALTRTEGGLVVAWGHDGNFVKVTADAGRSWFETDFQDGVDALKVVGKRLAIGELEFTGSGTQLPDLTYKSDASGRTWRLLARH